MKKNKIALFILPILVLFLIGIVSAETLVGGKIYSSDFTNPTANADITISCEHNGQTYSRSISSLGDGTYAIEFLETECNETDIVKVTATKGDFSGDSQGTINECDGSGGCEAAYFVIINVVMKQTTPDTGGSISPGGGSCVYNKNYDWQCSEWGKCIESMQVRSCKSYNNCHNTYGRPATSRACTVETSTGGENNLTTTSTSEEQETRKGITGAITGVFSTGKGIGVLIFIIAVVAIAIFVNVMRKKSLQK